MRSFVAGAGLLGLVFGLMLPPIIAQERGDKEHEHGGMKAKHYEEITIDKPFNDVALKMNEGVKKAGLILLSEIDWARVSSMKSMEMPGGHHLDAATTNVRTFFLGDDTLIRKVMEEPKHGLWPGPMVLCDKGGKTCAIFMRPSVKIEELKSHGMVPADEAEKHMAEAREYEKKLDQLLEFIKK
jgi:hypothetical protein